MILQPVLLLVFLKVVHARPQDFRLPELDVSTPEEVNSLERDEPISREVDPTSQNSIDQTVKEVEEIIKSNPALPRLTRGEILDLLENITERDEQKVKLLKQYRDPKAIMVVMPYTPTNDKNLEDFYTKAPITHIIGADPPKKEDTSKPKHSRRRPAVNFNDTDNDLVKKPLANEEKKKYSASISEKPMKPTPSRNQLRRRRPELITERVEPSTTTPSTTTFSTTTEAVSMSPTTYRPRTRRPVRRKTTTTQHPNHRYPEDYSSNEGIRIIEPPKLVPTPKEDLILEEDTKQETVMRQEIPISASLTTIHKSSSTFRPTAIPLITPTTTKPLTEDINLPEGLKNVVKDLNLNAALNPPEDKIQPSLDEQNRIKTLLASIGALPETTSTTTTAMPDAAYVADSLSPEMRDLLVSFGLLPNLQEKPPVPDPGKYYPEKAEVKPESYIGFKPLPDDGPSRDDMDALLASFGLGRSARKEKALKVKEEKKPYSFDMVPDHFKDVIKDLGLENIEREKKKIRTQEIQKTVEKQHVFNPDTQYATEEELEKLEKLIDMIKQLEKSNGTLKEEDLKKIDLENLKELVTSLNDNKTFVTLDEKDENSPNPNDYDVGIVKNEVKRQQSTTTVSSTTVEAETPSIKDLEASFGGQMETSTEAESHETTTKIKTGFYYLVDWNTFLDIDDTKGKRVNLRFQPTIGDPKRFLSVSVP